MPIAVSCPSCSAGFKVKDEHAGKRAKCPKCGEPLTVPGGAAPTPARPMSSPIAKALDDEANEKPKAKRRRDEDEDEKPRAKKRWEDDEGDEKPRAKKNRDDDEDEDDRPRRKGKGRGGPPKKGSALPLILGIVGGMLLLCGGGCAGVWFGVIEPVAAKARASNDAFQKEIDDALKKQPSGPGQPPATTRQPKPTEPSPKPTEPSPKPGVENKMLNKLTLSKLNSSYTLDKVEALLGKGRPADVATVTADAENVRTLTPDGITKYSEPQKALLVEYAKRGWVYRWDNLGDHALVVFRQPEAGGGLTEVIHTELGTTTKLRAVIMPIQEVVVVKAEDLAAEFDKDEKAGDKYKERLLTVSGTVVEVKTSGFTDEVILKGVTGNGRPVGVKVGMPVTDKKAGDLKPGDAVTYHCEYLSLGKGFDGKRWEVELRNGYRVKP